MEYDPFIKVNLPHAITFRALRGANLVTYHPRIWIEDPFIRHRCSAACTPHDGSRSDSLPDADQWSQSSGVSIGALSGPLSTSLDEMSVFFSASSLLIASLEWSDTKNP